MSAMGFLVRRMLCPSLSVYPGKEIQKNIFFIGSLMASWNHTGSDLRDPARLFFSPEVQKRLRKLTRVDMQKVYRHRKDGKKLEPPDYKFMTTEELNESLADAERRADQKLQIPPVVSVREEINEKLSFDTALQGYDEAKYIFTDITYGVSDKNRLIVVRDADGTLRKATWGERFRMNQIYFPLQGRQLRTPHMFEEEHLKRLLERKEYEFILDRACIQFEPDDPEYHAVTSAVYSHIESERQFETLLSTRHFGALVFYLAWNKCIDGMLLHNIDKDRLADAVDLIRVYHILNPEAKSAGVKFDDQPIPFIQAYIEQDSSKKGALQLALQTYQELARQRKEVEDGVHRAHGLSAV